MSTVAVGDIHGDAAALENLLAALLPELERKDTLSWRLHRPRA